MKLALKCFLGVACAALLALLVVLPGTRSGDGAGSLRPDPASVQPGGSSLELVEGAARSSSSPPPPDEPSERENRATPPDLLARLRAVARAFAESDVGTLESNLEALLGDPSVADLVLVRLCKGGLGDDVSALEGAVLTIVAGVHLYDQPDWNTRPECREFLGRVLDALPQVPMPWLERLVTSLVEARSGERTILGLAYLPKILALRAEHPDLAPVISLLLENVADELKETGAHEELYSLLLGETRDPTAVGVSLSALLAERSENFLPLAEEMHARARGDGDSELASAISQAIAASAPVDEAASALARLTDGSEYLAFHVLGTREGALDALSSEYTALVAQGDHPQARVMLVAGMGAQQEEVLLGIAATDLDSRVRAQAFLTASLGRTVSGDFVRALREAHLVPRGSQGGIGPDASVAIAGNVLKGSPGEPREAARKLLLEIAGDESIAERARWSAVAAVKPWVPAGTLRGFYIGGRAVE